MKKFLSSIALAAVLLTAFGTSAFAYVPQTQHISTCCTNEGANV